MPENEGKQTLLDLITVNLGEPFHDTLHNVVVQRLIRRRTAPRPDGNVQAEDS
jgi:hypothetical protein